MTTDQWIQFGLLILTMLSVVGGYAAIVAELRRDRRTQQQRLEDYLNNEFGDVYRRLGAAESMIRVLDQRITSETESRRELREMLSADLAEIKELVRNLAEKLSQHMENHR